MSARPAARPPAFSNAAAAPSGAYDRLILPMADKAPDPEGYLLAYEEAKRALDDQERAVGELRSRSGALIASAAITTSFFGGQALTRHHLHALGWIAVGCFVLLGAAVVAILWPRSDWEFDLSPQDFIATYLEPADGDALPLPMIRRDLALHMGASANANRQQLLMLTTIFRIAAILLVAEVVAWVAVLVQQS